MLWQLVVSGVAGAATTLLGVVVGGVLGRRTQERHWLKDTRAASCAAVLREYTRAEFDIRLAYLGKRAPVVDWAPWGAALAGLSLVADDEVVAAAERLSGALQRLDAFVHAGELDEGEWRDVQRAVVEAQMAFVNAARRSLDPSQAELRVRVGGPLITDSSPVGGPP
jgi:hypothetical protein